MGSYVPTTEKEMKEMLDLIGCKSIEDLFSHIPKEARIKNEMKLPKGQSELEISQTMESLAGQNRQFRSIFRGAGAYQHYIPAIVKSVSSKEEFVTSYTPYQAEISQGVLQSIFEFQTMICELTGLEISNASVYDGATAAAEAVVMCREKKRNKVLVSESTNPFVMETIATYCYGNGMELQKIPVQDGVTDQEELLRLADETTACLYVQNPNFYGIFEDVETMVDLIHRVGGKYIAGVHPIALGLTKAPGEYGADIAVGEGQPLGLPLSFGGPYLGFMTCTGEMTRKLPGRIVGQTTDANGKRAFVLTLQAREQHIRREKASSNVCSNQALCALTASAYLSAMGPKGMQEVAKTCMSKARYLEKELNHLGFKTIFDKEYFNEFVTSSPIDTKFLLEVLSEAGILGGYPLGDQYEGKILWCVTEMNFRQDIDYMISLIKKLL